MIRNLLDDAARSGTPDIPLIAAAYKRLRMMPDEARYDLATEAWVHARKSFDPSKARWSTYYYCTVDMIRRKRWCQENRRVNKPPKMISPWTDEGLDMLSLMPSAELPTYSDTRERIMREVRKLKPRVAAAVIAFYGLDGRPEMTQDAIGRKLGVSRERVRQMLVEGRDAMKEQLHGCL